LRYLSARLLAAQEEERKRVARELHDSIGSALSAIKFSLEKAAIQAKPDQSLTELLQTIIATVQQGIDEARRLMSDLRPSMLDDLGLITTIAWFLKQFRTIYSHIHIEETIGIEETDLPESLKIVVFRIIQEALHNIAKHSQAEFVEFSFVKREHTIELVIEDNGAGFDIESALTSDGGRGLGLTGMKERTEFTGGAFTAQSIVGQGTTIKAVWPLNSVASNQMQAFWEMMM
jgi:signal transduction histidine kinase